MENQKKLNENLTLLGAAHSLNHSLFVITPPLLSLMMATMGVTKSEIGLASTVASMVYGVGALLGGPLGDKFGEVKSISICLAMSGLPAPLMLLAGSANGLYVYAATLAFMAFWASFYHPIANSFISKVFKVKVPEAMGLHGVGGTLGIVLTPTVAWFLAVSFGWAWAFIVFAVFTVLVSLVFLKKAVHPMRLEGNRTTIFDALRIRGLGIVLVANVAIGLFMKGVELFFPIYLTDNRGIDPMWASIAYTLLLGFGVLGQWIGGKTISTIGSKKVMILTMVGTCTALASLLFIPAYGIGTAIFIGLYGFSFFGHQPALNAMIGWLSPHDQRGAVFGIYFFTNFGLGSISQFMAGSMSETYGLDSAFYLLTVFAVIALLLCFKLPEEEKRS